MKNILEKIFIYSTITHLLFILIPVPTLAQVEFGRWLGPSIGGQKARASYKWELYDKITVAGSEVDLELTHHDLSLSIPIAQDSEREWFLSATQGIHDVDTRACLPHTGECFPDTLQEISVWLTHRRLLTGRRIVGGHRLVGSASDKSFEGKDETTVQATGFLRIPHKGTNAWFLFVSYSNNREFLNHVPLPGCAYWHAPSQRFFVIVGIPFVSLTMRPTDDTSLSLSYFAIHTVHGSAKYQILKKLGLFAKFAWTNQAYYRADRLNHDDRLFYYEKCISTGATINLPREFIMEIEIVGAESLGVRGLCCVVNTRGGKILIDPGVALGYTRFRLLPHPLQVAIDERIQKRIIHEWATAAHIVISHFHGDHVPLANANPYQLDIEKVASLNPDAVIWAKSSQLSPTERKRASAFSMALNKNPIDAEGKSRGVLCFSRPVPHGKAERLETVIMTRIEDDSTFVHASDIQLLNDEAISQIVSWWPDIVLLSGPPLYLHKLTEDDIKRAWHNAIRLSQKVDTLIIDHHLLRSLEGAEWLTRLSLKAPRNVVCSADFMGKPRMLLEAMRPQLYEEMGVPKDWHDSYARGRVHTDHYWNLARELYAKRGLNHYRWVNEAYL